MLVYEVSICLTCSSYMGVAYKNELVIAVVELNQLRPVQ
jgi:hypothetical protein